MSIAPNPPFTALDYERAADEYYVSLPLEHFMEATHHALQRQITLDSLALLKSRRGGFTYFNELLIQYWHDGRLRSVVPDNMVILSDEPFRRRKSYPVALETERPFMVLEYVSEDSQKKDYEDRFENYEQELKPPYCLHFHPDRQDLRVYRHDGTRYVRLEPDLQGRIAIPELDLEVGLHDEWMRYWHRGELLELPAELDQQMNRLQEQVKTHAKEIASQKRELADKDRKLADKDRKLADKDRKLADELQRWRRRVERHAQRAGRDDILQQLPTTSDTDQLELWLDELES